MAFCGDDYVNTLLATVLAVINRDSGVHRRSDDEINVKIAGSIPVARPREDSRFYSRRTSTKLLSLSILVVGLALALPVTQGSWQILSLCYLFSGTTRRPYINGGG